MDSFDVGSLVNANFSIGRHPGIVLSTKEEIAATGVAQVVAISENNTISHPDDLIEVPRMLGMRKKCYVQCGESEMIDVTTLQPRNKRAWGVFLNEVVRRTRAAYERKKSTQS